MKKKFFIPEKYLELVFGLGASVVIIGALLKITHKDFIFSGNTWLTAGLITEAVIFMIAGLRGYAVTNDDDHGDVTPEAAISDVSKEVDALKEAFTGATKQIQNLTGSLQSATIAAATIKIPENFQVNVDELNNRLASASVSVSQVQDVYNSIEKSFDGQPQAHREVVSASDKLVVQLEEMNSLVKQLNEKYAAISKAMGN
ncbi:MAG: gliding motility protein GldL [Flavobacteriaceae bacterium]|nr:gliding motility protein GldL [Flavobacteriaceae bacterium]